jgi:ribosome recycling factor
MIDRVNAYIAEAEDHMKKAIQHLESELLRIRASKANPAMLEGVHVDYYGSMTPLMQVANVNTPDARTLVIQPWEKSMLVPIGKAITNANLGFNPQDDGTVIRITVPPLTEERRKDLVKKTRAEGEHSKVGIRSARRDANEHVKKLIKEGLAEDVVKEAEGRIQHMTDNYIVVVDKHLEVKEKEIMTV